MKTSFQVLLNMLVFGMNPQEALDAPRYLVGSGHLSAYGDVKLEAGIAEAVVDVLRERGHEVRGQVTGHERAVFGRGQIIACREFWNESRATCANPKRVLWAASDPRSDGCAIGY